MKLLVKYTDGKTEIVYIDDENLNGTDWRKYVQDNFKGIEDAYCNLRESLRNSTKERTEGSV